MSSEYVRSSSGRIQRFINLMRLKFSRPQNIIGFILLLLLVYLILIPVIEMVKGTLVIQERDVSRIGGSIGSFTTYYWQRMLTSDFAPKIFYEPFRNTMFISICYTIIAMIIGLFLAWLIVKTDLPFKPFIGTIAIIPYVLPSWSVAMAWIIAFRNNRIGHGAAGVIQSLTGIVTPDWLVYGQFPIIAVLSLNYFAFAYLLGAAAFSSIDASLEESAMIQGASGKIFLWRITLPLILPAVGSAFILTFARGLGNFAVPALLGFPVRYYVLSTTLYQSANIGRYGDAFVIAVILISISAITMYMNSTLIGKRKQFTTITGKGTRSRIIPLGRWRIPTVACVLLFLILSGIVPVFLLLWQSLQLRLGDFSIGNLTLTYWTGFRDGFSGILMDKRVHIAAWNTIKLGFSIGLITAFAGLIIGYILNKERGTKFAMLIEQLTFAPYLMPPIAFGLIYLSMWSGPHGPLPAMYGTFGLLLLALSVNRLPFATRTGSSAMGQIHVSLEEAGEVHGAGVFLRFKKILFPLTRKGFLAGFILTFVSTVKDLDLVALLVVPRTTVLTVLSYGYMDIGRPQFAYAIGIIIITIVLSGTWLVRKLTNADPFRGIGGGSE